MIGARVRIIPKRSVLDPQGEAVQRALHELGHELVQNVRLGRVVELLLDSDDAQAAREAVDQMCIQLLVNDVVEACEVDLVDAGDVGAAELAHAASSGGG